MNEKKKKLILAAVAGLLTAALLPASTNPVYAMGKKPEKTSDAHACGGKSGCGGKTAE